MASQVSRASRFAPLVFDDEEAIEGLATMVLRVHDTIASNGRCYASGQTSKKAGDLAGRVESVLVNAFCTIFGSSPLDRYQDVFDQASYLAEHLAKDHVFEDGNKRTSLIVSVAVLTVRGASLNFVDNKDPETNPYYRWIQDVVAGEKTQSELADELRRGCIGRDVVFDGSNEV